MARPRGIKQRHPLGSVASRTGISPLTVVAVSSASTGVKISELPAASAASDTDQMEVNQGGVSKRLTLDQVATAVAASDQIGEVIDASSGAANVRSFGAQGWPADDTAAIQAAFDAMPTFRGCVYFPAGHYLCGPLTVTGKVSWRIFGDGRATSILALTSAGALLTISGANFSSVENLGFQLDGTAQAIAGTKGIHVVTSGNTIFSYCDFNGFADQGLFCEGTVPAPLSGMKVLNCNFLDNGAAQLHFFCSNDFHIENCSYGNGGVVTPATFGCLLDASGSGTYTANYHWTNDVGLKSVNNSAFTVYTANRFEINNHEGAIFDGERVSNFSDNRVYSNSMSGNGLYDNISFTDTDRMVVSDNNVFTWDASYAQYGMAFYDANTFLYLDNNQNSTGFDPAKTAFHFSAGTSVTGNYRDSVTGNIIHKVTGQTTITEKTDGTLGDLTATGMYLRGANDTPLTIDNTNPAAWSTVAQNYYVADLLMAQTMAQREGTGLGCTLYLSNTDNSGASQFYMTVDKAQAISIPNGITTKSGTAVGAGANTQAFVKASSTANLGIYYGTGNPTFSAAKGSLYSKTDATTTTTRLWVNTDGSTTWASFTSSA